MAQPNIRQLLNTSWTLHRLSPLHHGDECQYLLNNPTALNTYATRLRDQLTGDVLAGLQLGISGAGVGGGADEDDTLSKTGALKTCTWETISHLADGDDNYDSHEGSAGTRGILIVLEYENITYKAALLAAPSPSTTTTTQSKGSTSLPLLLTKCPSPLRRTLIAFLSTNFDTYCSPLRLPSHAMCDGMDVYVNTFLASDDDTTTAIPGSSPRDILQDVVKDMQITLSLPPSVAPALRSLNINIPRAFFGEFLSNSPSSSSTSTSHLDSSSSTSTANSPFFPSISAYLEKHLALKLDLRAPGKQPVRLSKIACGGFVLGSEGRMKLVARSGQDDSGDDDGGDRLQLRAVEMLLRDILNRAVVGENVTK